MKKLLRSPFIFLLLTFCFFSLSKQGFISKAQAIKTEGIAAIVNDDAISYSDVEDRVQLIIISSGLPNNEEIKEKVLPQALNSLVEEQIKLQEASKLELSVDEEELAFALGNLAKQNNVPEDKFQFMLEKSGINFSTLERQVRSQIAWTKVIRSKLKPKVKISDTDISDTLERLQQNVGNEAFLIAEIFLPVEEPAQEKNMKQLADRLVGQMTGGKAPFYSVAQQFSKAAGAAQGGDMGWVHKDQLPEEIANIIDSVNKGEISPPIRSLTGFHIIYLRDKKFVDGENIPSADEVRQTIGFERLERLQRRYYMDLKASAFIESRV